MKKILFGLIIILSCNSSDKKQSNIHFKDKLDIVSVIDSFINIINKKDLTLVNKVIDNSAYRTKYSISEDSSFFEKNKSDFSFLKKSKVKYFEKYFEPIINTDGFISSVWLPYEFFIDNEFSHCGNNMFFLMKKNNKWIITDYAYSVNKNCGK